MKTLPLVLHSAVFSAALSCVPSLVHASTLYWDTTATGLWTTGANWSNNAVSGGTTGTAPISTDTVVFNQSSINGDETVQFGADATITGITFANTGTTLLDSSSSTARTLTITTGITVNSGAGGVTIGDSTNTLNVALSQSTNTFTLNGATSLTFLNQVNITNTGAANNTFTLNGAGNTVTFNGLALNAGNKVGRVVAINGSANVVITGAVADGGSTAATFTYSGTGKLMLSGANTYTGVTNVSSGMMQFAKETSLYNGTTASWTAANLIVASGATVAFNVGGSGEFTTGDVTTLITNIDRAVSSNGLKSGSFLGFDTTNAAGGSFTISDSIQNTTSTGGGAVGVTKLGTNTLVLSGANTYTGATTINGGTLALGASNALATGTAITLGGGTLNLGGFNPAAAFTTALTMTAGSTIDFGSHVTGITLKFGNSSAAAWTGTLSLLNFTVGTDNLSFTSVSGLTVAQLSQISLAGYTATGLNSSGNVQFSAVPEPSTFAALAGLAGLGLAVLRRRRAA